MWALCLRESTLLVCMGSKDASWEELACESLCSGTLSSTRFSLNTLLQPFRYVGIIRVSPYLFVTLILIWFWDFGWFIQRAHPHFHLTRLRDGDPSHTDLTVLVYPHFRLTRLLEGDLNDQSPLKMSWVLK